jgi:hypothetical protein
MRNLMVLPDDVFLVSFPKSGNTWTRFLVANLLYPERRPDFRNIGMLVPDLEEITRRHLERIPRPRILKSHQYFDPRYRRVVYIVRDPRDVALSQYHFHRKRRLIADDYPLETFTKEFLADFVQPYGSWAENVASWLGPRDGSDGFLLLRYEDMLANTQTELAKIGAFLGVPTSPEQLAVAVENSSADVMRRLEKAQYGSWSTTKNTRPDLPFVRAAKSGNWKTDLPESLIVQIETAWGPLMKRLGYTLSVASHVEALT